MKKKFAITLFFAIIATYGFGQLKVVSSGHVIIGPTTTWDDYNLNITGSGTSGSEGLLGFGDNSTTVLNVLLGEYGTGDTDKLLLHGDNGIHFSISESISTKMYLSDVGYLGLGTTSPSYKLDVYSGYIMFDYTARPLKFNLFNTDPRICSDSKIVFYKANNTDHIDIECDDLIETSDSTLKTEIRDIESSSEIVAQLEGVTYLKKNELDGPRRSGLIAQEVEKILPGVVYTNDSTGIMLISYTKIIPYLVEAIKEQQGEIEELKTQVSANPDLKKSADIQTSSNPWDESSQPTLSQNIPNPFNENTIIKYSIPIIESYAMVNVYDLQGGQVKSYNISQTGDGEIMIPASELNPGLFIYNLVVDGIEVASKRMVLTE